MRRSLAIVAGLGLWLGACLMAREPGGREDTTCTACHGDSSRSGEALDRAAPPRDLRGNTELRFPGVGAHQRHLSPGALFPKVTCERCHPVPLETTSAGHNDGKVQVVVASRDGGGENPFNPLTRTCAGSACHLVASGAWTKPLPEGETCGSCHGVPPPPPHPATGACSSCHGELSAKTHLDGVVNRVSDRCDACHGADGVAAPPRALDGGTGLEHRGVGAHRAHLSGGATSQPVACETCHEVPASVATPSHPNGGPAEVKPAVGFDAATATCRNACHGNQGVDWQKTGPLACTACHGAPPAYPHPQMSDCTTCHPAVDAEHRAQHVNGQLEVTVPPTCNGCHGSPANAAPPRDLDGGSSTASRGVGAHQAHVVGRGLARPVLCAECHTVPAEVRSAGHLDGVVDVRFSGVAVNGALTPSYANGTCTSSACHDLSAYTGGASAGGSSPAPVWTRVDGGQATCTSCHGQPPPPPHAARADCGSCHRLEPERHVNGHLDFTF